MQFFLVDFAVAFVALLGYRALAAVTRDPVPAVSFTGRASGRQGGGDTVACAERPPHRLINFW